MHDKRLMRVACFITPLVVGVVLAVIKRIWKGAERVKLDLLVYMMLGGALILMVEHVWHGEIAPWPPFLTAMKSPENIPILVNEILRVGGSMTLAVTGVWLLLLGFTRKLQVNIAPPKRITTTLSSTST